MIKHHPSDEMLFQYTAGQLPSSLSAAIAIHVEMCPHCQQIVQKQTQQQASEAFDQEDIAQVDLFQEDLAQQDLESVGINHLDEFNIDAMIDSITADESIAQTFSSANLEIKVKDHSFTLPRALSQLNIGNFGGLGKISRAKIELGEGQLHSHLLYMAPKGEVPMHTHKGFELTLVLDGEFEDDMGRYQAGDFVFLDKNHQHNPVTKQGCLCMTVVSDALYFTEGISKLLNPLGKFIY